MDRLDELVDRFLSWPMPDTVCADLCATHQHPGRTGTNLLTAGEAKQMLRHVLSDVPWGPLPDRQQQTVMRFDPATGDRRPYPSHAEQWRVYHGKRAWLFNPWTGTPRDASDVGTDTFGLLVIPPDEPVYADARG